MLLSTQPNINKRNLGKLFDFFPDANVSKFEEIEKFHEDISSLMQHELEETKDTIEKRINLIDKEIDKINAEIKQNIDDKEIANFITNNIIELAKEKSNIEISNHLYSAAEEKKSDKKNIKSDLDQMTLNILSDIERKINDRIRKYTSQLDSRNSTPPMIKLNEKNYDYRVSGNTGTGKAYTDLVLFDLSVLSLTFLPMYAII